MVGGCVRKQLLCKRQSQYVMTLSDNHFLFLMCLLVSWGLAHRVWVYLECLFSMSLILLGPPGLAQAKSSHGFGRSTRSQAEAYEASSAKCRSVMLLVLDHSVGQSDSNDWTHNQGLGKSNPLLEWKEIQSHGKEYGYSEGWRAGPTTVSYHREEGLWLPLVTEATPDVCSCDMLVCPVVVMMAIITRCYWSLSISPNSSDFGSTSLPRQPSDDHSPSYMVVSARYGIVFGPWDRSVWGLQPFFVSCSVHRWALLILVEPTVYFSP